MKNQQISRKLSRQEVIDRFIEDFGMDIRELATGIRVKAESHEGNPLAPELWCYKITFTMFGQKRRYGYWPNTVSYQGY